DRSACAGRCAACVSRGCATTAGGGAGTGGHGSDGIHAGALSDGTRISRKGTERGERDASTDGPRTGREEPTRCERGDCDLSVACTTAARAAAARGAVL